MVELVIAKQSQVVVHQIHNLKDGFAQKNTRDWCPRDGVACIEREQPIRLSPGVLDEPRNARYTCRILFLNESTVEIVGMNNVQGFSKASRRCSECCDQPCQNNSGPPRC